MPAFIGREKVQQLVADKNAILAEVLPRPECEWAHLAGAIHLPLKGWDVAHVEEQLDVDRPVIGVLQQHRVRPEPARRLATRDARFRCL